MTRTKLIVLISGGVIVLAAAGFLLAQQLGWLKLSADLLPNTDPDTIEYIFVRVTVDGKPIDDAGVALKKGQRANRQPLWGSFGIHFDGDPAGQYVFRDVSRYQGVTLQANYQKESAERADCTYYWAERTIDIPGSSEIFSREGDEQISLPTLELKKTLDKDNGRIIFKATDIETGQSIDKLIIGNKIEELYGGQWKGPKSDIIVTVEKNITQCIFPTKEGYNKVRITGYTDGYELSAPVEVTIHPGDNYVQFLLKQEPEEPKAESASPPAEAEN